MLTSGYNPLYGEKLWCLIYFARGSHLFKATAIGKNMVVLVQ